MQRALQRTQARSHALVSIGWPLALSRALHAHKLDRMPWFRSGGRSRSRARFTHTSLIACPGFDRVAHNDDASLIDNNNIKSRQPQLPLSILIGTSSGARLLPAYGNAKTFLRGRGILPFYSTIKASPFGLRGTLWHLGRGRESRLLCKQISLTEATAMT